MNSPRRVMPPRASRLASAASAPAGVGPLSSPRSLIPPLQESSEGLLLLKRFRKKGFERGERSHAETKCAKWDTSRSFPNGGLLKRQSPPGVSPPLAEPGAKPHLKNYEKYPILHKKRSGPGRCLRGSSVRKARFAQGSQRAPRRPTRDGAATRVQLLTEAPTGTG